MSQGGNMTREKTPYTLYKPMPTNSRFWIYSESCYTEAELNFREWALKLRTHSGIHADYLVNPSSWFATEEQQAFINIHQNSWFYANAYKPRHVLSRNDFYVKLEDGQRLEWPQLYELMQKTGDYLLLRNQDFSLEHLNQPMNFLLLDINNILKGLSQNPNINQTRKQLGFLARYILAIEKNTSPLVGSDRLFLANFRITLTDEIQPQLSHLLESQLLRGKLGELSRDIKQLSMERNRILHFALSSNKANPHPYDFNHKQLGSLKAYPTLAAKECARSSNTEVQVGQFSPLTFTAQQLRECPDFKLISTTDDVLDDYAKGMSGLSNLMEFQNIINGVIDLLGQAGEVYTVYQFKEQLLLVLNLIDDFVDESSASINAIIRANTQAYHQAIYDEQNLSFLESTKRRIFSERSRLTEFIENHDVLAQFPSTTTDLEQTNQNLKQSISSVKIHLNRPLIKKTNFAALARQAHELNTLMTSMHGLVKMQYEAKGLVAPTVPEQLTFIPQAKPVLNSVKPLVELRPPSLLSQPTLFFAPSVNNTNTTSSQLAPGALGCLDNQSTCNAEQSGCAYDNSSKVADSQFPEVYMLGLITLIPLAIIIYYLLFKSNPPVEHREWGSRKEYYKLKTKLDDYIARVKDTLADDDLDGKNVYEEFIYQYNELNESADLGNYPVKDLKELFEDMYAFFQEKSTSEIKIGS